MRKIKAILKHWSIVVVVTTAFCGLAYATVQQTLRQGANDPQIQIVEDITSQLENGETAASVTPANQVDLAHSLAPFMILFNDQGTQIASSGRLHGQSPALPNGVLDYTRRHGEDRITWQPEPGVRIATIVIAYTGANPGFVLVGRSMREVERRIDQITLFCGVTWIATLNLAFIAIAAGELFLSG